MEKLSPNSICDNDYFSLSLLSLPSKSSIIQKWGSGGQLAQATEISHQEEIF